jgi:hypothetical protein
MLDFASSSDVEDKGLTAAPSASDTELLDAYSHAVTTVADTVGPAVCHEKTNLSSGASGVGTTKLKRGNVAHG